MTTRDSMPKRSVCFVITSPFALNAFMINHLRSLADDHKVTVCVNTKESPVSPLLDSRIELLNFPIEREISLLRDIYALFWLIRLFQSRHFSAVHSLTPKGGLLAMVAAFLTRMPHRTHTFTGQVWMNRHGFMRALLKSIDRIIASCATALQADSASQARFLEEQGVCKKDSIRVFGSGSVSGVDLNRFSVVPGRRERIRKELGIPADANVYVFVGRLHPEKGVLVLAEAFVRLSTNYPEVWLLFVGPDEGGVEANLLRTCGKRCRSVGLTSRPEAYLDASDVLCLPSYREGFGTVVVEAAAMGLPAIVSRIYGLSDAVVADSTGIFVPVGDVEVLHEAMFRLLDPGLRLRLGNAARERAHAEFSAEHITNYWRNYYLELLASPPRDASK
jgi:glycosyltransferase involved in cell wall biosynthesis